jgi:REase_DpnII-MboI
VVFVTELPSLLRLRECLAEAGKDDPEQPHHARAFGAWVQPDIPLLKKLATQASVVSGPARRTAHAAVLGYAAHLDPAFIVPFVEALDWLQQRQYFVAGRPLAFEVDGLGLFGTAVGIISLDDDRRTRPQAWLEKLLRRSLDFRRPSDWNEALTAAALNVLVGEADSQVSTGIISDDLRAALAAKTMMVTSAASRATAWNIISGLIGAADGMTRAAAQLAALTYLLRDTSTLRFGSVSIEDVARVLSGVGRSLRRWSWDERPRTQKSVAAQWEIDNEYHVQDMLWAILAPIFPDLDDEEWLKSLGQHRPRADLAIPSLELIIEVKFIRPGGRSVFTTVIQEVAADASTYLQEGSGYRHIIAFVWDDAARTEEHAELRQGLMRIRGVRDAVVLPRPSRMKRAHR